MAKSILQMKAEVSEKVTNALVPGSVTHEAVGGWLESIFSILNSTVANPSGVFQGLVGVNEVAPASDITDNLLYMSAVSAAGTYKYTNLGGLSVTTAGPALIFLSRVAGTWASDTVDMKGIFDSAVANLEGDVVDNTDAIATNADAIAVNATAIQAIKTQIGTRFAYKEVDSLDGLVVAGVYTVKLGGFYGTLCVAGMAGAVYLQTYITNQILSDGTLLQEGSMAESFIYSRRRVGGVWSEWLKVPSATDYAETLAAVDKLQNAQKYTSCDKLNKLIRMLKIYPTDDYLDEADNDDFTADVDADQGGILSVTVKAKNGTALCIFSAESGYLKPDVVYNRTMELDGILQLKGDYSGGDYDDQAITGTFNLYRRAIDREGLYFSN